MPRPDRSPEIDHALLAQVAAHPKDLVRVVAAALSLSRAAVATRARVLIGAGYLAKAGTTRPTYRPGTNRRAVAEHALADLDENAVWLAVVAPLLQRLPANVIDICHYGVTEMVNNAIDHSQGQTVRLSVDRDVSRVALIIADDGLGIFRKITRALDLPDERLALLELAKGKLTTDPRRHSGEGVFFTSRMFDRFQIASHDLVFDHDASRDDELFDIDPRSVREGTTVLMEIATDATRIVAEVFDAYSSGPEDYAFARTVVPVRLAKVGDENLISRSQARRVLQRIDRFRTVVFDFAGVAGIGQAFADEIFRVFANAHPDIELIPIHATAAVQQMLRRAAVLRDEECARR